MGRAVHLTQHKRFQGPTRAGGLYNVLPQEMSSDHTVHDTPDGGLAWPGKVRCTELLHLTVIVVFRAIYASSFAVL